MAQAIIKMDEHADRILNIIKAKEGLKNKSDAMNFLIENYEENFLEPELRPEFVERMKKKEKEKRIPFKNIDELRALIENAQA